MSSFKEICKLDLINKGACPLATDDNITKYVDFDTGNDSNSGDESSPFKTIHAAISWFDATKQRANTALIIVVSGGGVTSSVATPITIKNMVVDISCEDESPAMLVGDNDGNSLAFKIEGSTVTLSNLTIQKANFISISGKSEVDVSYITIDNTSGVLHSYDSFIDITDSSLSTSDMTYKNPNDVITCYNSHLTLYYGDDYSVMTDCKTFISGGKSSIYMDDGFSGSINCSGSFIDITDSSIELSETGFTVQVPTDTTAINLDGSTLTLDYSDITIEDCNKGIVSKNGGSVVPSDVSTIAINSSVVGLDLNDTIMNGDANINIVSSDTCVSLVNSTLGCTDLELGGAGAKGVTLNDSVLRIAATFATREGDTLGTIFQSSNSTISVFTDTMDITGSTIFYLNDNSVCKIAANINTTTTNFMMVLNGSNLSFLPGSNINITSCSIYCNCSAATIDMGGVTVTIDEATSSNPVVVYNKATAFLGELHMLASGASSAIKVTNFSMAKLDEYSNLEGGSSCENPEDPENEHLDQCYLGTVLLCEDNSTCICDGVTFKRVLNYIAEANNSSFISALNPIYISGRNDITSNPTDPVSTNPDNNEAINIANDGSYIFLGSISGGGA